MRRESQRGAFSVPLVIAAVVIILAALAVAWALARYEVERREAQSVEEAAELNQLVQQISLRSDVYDRSVISARLQSDVFVTLQLSDGDIASVVLKRGVVVDDTLRDGAIVEYTDGALGTLLIDPSGIATVQMNGESVHATVIDYAVTTATLPDELVLEIKLTDATIEQGRVQNGEVRLVNLLTGSVTVVRVEDGVVVGIVPAANSVTAEELADGSVTGEELADGSVSSRDLAAGAVTSENISDLSITAAKIAAGTITKDQIAKNGGIVTSIVGNRVIEVTEQGDGTYSLGLGAKCSSNELLKWDGDSWECAPDLAGADIEDVSDAAYLTLQESTGLSKETVVSALGSPLTFAGNTITLGATDDTVNVGGLFQLQGTAVSASAAELNFLSGVASNIQGQLDDKQASLTAGDVTTAMLAGLITDDKLTQLTTAEKVAGSAIQLGSNPGLQDSSGLSLELADSTLTLAASGVAVADLFLRNNADDATTGSLAVSDLLLSPKASATASEGRLYYDSDTSKAYVYDGTSFVDVSVDSLAELSDVNTASTTNGNILMADGTDWESVAQTNITSLGTITAGTWQGSEIADAYVSDSITASNYLPLTGGSVSGDIALGSDDNIKRSDCPSGYVLVPGNSSLGTEDFCFMKYPARQDGTTKAPVSTASGTIYNNISLPSGINSCRRAGGHLVTPQEWMTVARNIESTTINDLDDDAGVQLATGHSDNSPASRLTATAASDPIVSGCDLNETMENAANAYAAGSCEIRGDGTYGGDDDDFGFYGTGQDWNDSTYSAGGANKSQLRTHVLSNGEVVWDMAGNIWQLTNGQCVSSPWDTTVGPLAWTDAGLTDFEKIVAGPSGSLTSTNGAGVYYGCTANNNPFYRSGDYGYGANSGIYTLGQGATEADDDPTFGFRCAL